MPKNNSGRGQRTANEPQDDGTTAPQPPSRLEADGHGRGQPGQEVDLFDRKLTPARRKEAIARLLSLTECDGTVEGSVEELVLRRVLKLVSDKDVVSS
jgi:hypothetical protein